MTTYKQQQEEFEQQDSGHVVFMKKIKCWNREDQDVSNFSDDIIYPRCSKKQEPYVETPHYETYKQDGLAGMIKNWQNLNIRLQSEKSAKLPNIKKIKSIEEKLDLIAFSLLRDKDYISHNLHVSVNELLQARVR